MTPLKPVDTVYGLSYETRGETPTLILSVKKEGKARLFELLGESPLHPHASYVDKDRVVHFSLTDAFGFDSCGTVEEDGERVRLAFPLSKKHLRATAASISRVLFCFSALEVDQNKAVDENDQLLTFDTTCDFEHDPVHDITGYMSPDLLDWLGNYYLSHALTPVGKSNKPRMVALLPQNFTDAMNLAWHKLTGKQPEPSSKESPVCWIEEKKRFEFSIPAETASLESDRHNIMEIQSYGCDVPEIQLTLLVGLFSLFELVQKHPHAESAP